MARDVSDVVGTCRLSHQGACPPVAVTTSEIGALPAGCSVVAMLDPSVSTRVASVLDAALANHIANLSTVGGVDFRRDIRHVRYCQAGPDTATSPLFLLLLVGDISNVLAAVAARPGERWDREQIGVSPVVGRGSFWAADRGAAGRVGELLLAND